MALGLYVRTGVGGSNPAYEVRDLGYEVPAGASFKILTVETPTTPADGYGQFTAYQLRYSNDLYVAIKGHFLEYSNDGVTMLPASSYTPDTVILQNFVDDSVHFASLSADVITTADGYNLSDHLNNGSHKHIASSIDVQGTYDAIPGTPTDLESVISAINTALVSTAGFAFSIVHADSGTNPVADSSADTLNVFGSNGITTIGTAGTDTLTVSGLALLPRDGSRPLTGNLNFDGYTGTNVPTPTVASQIANKGYVDSVAAGLNFKDEVYAKSTVNVALTGLQTLDGVSVLDGYAVLLSNQTDATQNGIWIVHSGAWARRADADTSAEVRAGMYAFIEKGTLYADSGWVLATDNPIVLGTTPLSFVKFTGAGQIIAGDGMVKSNNTLDVVGTPNRITANPDSIDIAATYVGQASITTLGTIGTGTWQGSPIAPAFGGTGITTTPQDGYTLIGSGSGFSLSRITAGTAINVANSPGHITISHTQVGSGDLHTEYLKANGTRALTAPWTPGQTLTLNPATSTDAAVVLTPDSVAPTTNVVDGALTIVAGILYAYDAGRAKWLSVGRQFLTAGKSGLANDVSLRTHDSVVMSNTAWRALRNGTITGMFAQTVDTVSWTLEVRLNGLASPVATLAITTAAGGQSTSTDVNFAVGDTIELFANTTGNISNPLTGIEIAWRV